MTFRSNESEPSLFSVMVTATVGIRPPVERSLTRNVIERI
jgi:hypothetical protein